MGLKVLPKLQNPVEGLVEAEPRETGRETPRVSLQEVQCLLDAEILWAADLSVTFDAVGAADLMSDVLAFCQPGMLLLTGLATVQTIRTAVIADLQAVVFVHGKKPDPNVLALAAENRIPILTTRMTMFQAAGLLYKRLSSGHREAQRQGRGDGPVEKSGRARAV